MDHGGPRESESAVLLSHVATGLSSAGSIVGCLLVVLRGGCRLCSIVREAARGSIAAIARLSEGVARAGATASAVRTALTAVSRAASRAALSVVREAAGVAVAAGSTFLETVARTRTAAAAVGGALTTVSVATASRAAPVRTEAAATATTIIATAVRATTAIRATEQVPRNKMEESEQRTVSQQSNEHKRNKAPRLSTKRC